MIEASYGAHLIRDSTTGLGFTLSRNYVVFDQGTAFIHRDSDEWYNRIPQLLVAATQSPASYAYMRNSVEETASSIQYFERFLIQNPAAIASSLTGLYDAIMLGVPGMIF